MYLFETSWMSDFKYYERMLNTNTNKTEIREINGKTEYYEYSPKGIYKGIIDGLSYAKRLGNSKDARDKCGVCKPIYRNIRDHYWKDKQYNKNPRIWFIDIETRSGRKYLHKIPEKLQNIKVFLKEKTTNKVIDIKFKEIHNYVNENDYLFSYNDIEYSELKNMPFMEKTEAFPSPLKAQHEITLIQIYDNIEKKLFVLGLKEFNLQELNSLGYKLDADVRYINCQNEVKLITVFISLFKKLDPLILFAWNGLGFDYLYLHNRIKYLKLPYVMSNYGNASINERLNEKNQTVYQYQSDGHVFMDFMDVYKKFTFEPQASYSLDAIAHFELNDNKIQHNEFLTFDSFYTGTDYQYTDIPYDDKLRELIRINYKENKKLFEHYVQLQFIYYGIYDVILLKKIDDKLKLSHLITTISEKMGILFSDALGTVKPWAQYIANSAYQQNLIMPMKTEHEHPNIVGGFVRHPLIGKHKWVMNLDVNSMYPNLSITAFNMSPETYTTLDKIPNDLKDLILSIIDGQDEHKFLDLDDKRKQLLSEKLKKYHYSMGINGALFKQEATGIIPQLVTEIYDQRKAFKKQMLKYQAKSVEIKDILHKRENS